MGFFTDTSVCIGCKACEVACKEWNQVPEDGLDWTGDSHDNTGGLGADTWRHVAFIEQRVPVGVHEANFQRDGDGFRWLMASDVCKHCTHAACLDVCPTGAIFRTEFGTVVVQAGHLQRLRLLRAGVPVRGDRQARGRRPGLQVHALLRPARGRPGAGVREGLPDGLDPVRRARRAARRAPAGRVEQLHDAGVDRGAAVRARPRRRRRRRRRVLPAARRARGLRAAARPGRHDPRPADDVGAVGSRRALLPARCFVGTRR